MLGFLAPFLIAFGVGAGIAALLTLLAMAFVTVREFLLLVWGLVKLAGSALKELAAWPAAFAKDARESFRRGYERGRRGR